MPKDLVVLVTGSSRGIGAALAAGFARAGHRVVVNYAHAAAEAAALATSLAADVGDRVMCVKADVARLTSQLGAMTADRDHGAISTPEM